MNNEEKAKSVSNGKDGQKSSELYELINRKSVTGQYTRLSDWVIIRILSLTTIHG
jgi:hypothetical protein